MIAVADAYARCEEITRAEAKNFSYGIRLLPEPKRNAMSAQMIRELTEVAAEIAGDDAIRAVILAADERLSASTAIRIYVG